MFTDPTPPPAEWLHSKECLAEAIIAAVQNFRDDLSTAHDFRLNAQDNAFLHAADEYLVTGLMTCSCARTCPRGKGPWECTTGSEQSREKLCDECIGDRIAAAVDAGDFNAADEYGYQRWSRMEDDIVIEQKRLSYEAGAIREVIIMQRILEERGLV